MEGRLHNIEGRRGASPAGLLSRDYLTVAPIERWLREVAAPCARGTLLDAGCGNKPYAGLFRTVTECYIGADLTQNAFNTVDVIVDPSHCLPFREGSFDTVLSTQVLEHVPDPAAYLAEVRRVLTRGGHLLLTCPASYMLHEEPHDYFRFTEHGIRILLQRVGLTVVRVDTAGGAWRLIGQILLNHKAFGRRWHIPILSGIVYVATLVVSNLTFSLLDSINTNRRDTANYMIIAQK